MGESVSTSEAPTPVAREAAETRKSLLSLVETLERHVVDITTLIERASGLADHVVLGRPLSEVMAEEERPLIVTTLTRILDELADAGAGVRRAEAQQLRSEGMSHAAIAEVFGVSRQRAAALLAPPPPPNARAAKRSPSTRTPKLHSL